ncbi:MAG: hypothetical protein WD801_11330 [Gemmatimonadaceae bacterium]
MRPVLSLLALATGLMMIAPADASAQKKSRDKLTREEIMASAQKDQDLFQAIRRLKPHFLQGPRGSRSLGGGMQYPLVIYVNGVKADGEVLQSTRASDVEEVRYLDPTRSQNEYGISANGGALQIKLVNSSPLVSKDP